MKRLLIAALALLLMAGCASVNTTFVYKPGGPAAGGAKLPVKVAVLPFKDGTEDFTKRGSIAKKNLTYNLAKTGIGGQITALTPELWAKAFADDMAASGTFRAVRFIYSPSELTDEELYIEGTVEKAYAPSAMINPNEFALSLRALRRTDNRPAWEKEVTRVWKTSKAIYDGCGRGIQCRVDRYHAVRNRVMQGMFAEAREDLARAVGSSSGSGTGREDFLSVPTAGEATRAAPSRPPAPESVEQTIDRILREK